MYKYVGRCSVTEIKTGLICRTLTTYQLKDPKENRWACASFGRGTKLQILIILKSIWSPIQRNSMDTRLHVKSTSFFSSYCYTNSWCCSKDITVLTKLDTKHRFKNYDTMSTKRIGIYNTLFHLSSKTGMTHRNDLDQPADLALTSTTNLGSYVTTIHRHSRVKS